MPDMSSISGSLIGPEQVSPHILTVHSERQSIVLKSICFGISVAGLCRVGWI